LLGKGPIVLSPGTKHASCGGRKREQTSGSKGKHSGAVRETKRRRCSAKNQKREIETKKVKLKKWRLQMLRR